MSVQGTISHPGNRERYLASKRAELDKDVGGGKLRGTLEDRYIRATRYTLSLRQCGLPHYLLVSYLFWEAPEEARNFLPWVYIALDEDGTTGVFAARPFVDGSYVGETGGDLWGPVGGTRGSQFRWRSSTSAGTRSAFSPSVAASGRTCRMTRS
eukprot:jgi/Mesvir1/17759/Mv18996-RA.1